MMTAIWILRDVFIALQICDAASTFVILNQGGQEDNWLILAVGKKIGIRWALVLFKLLAIAAVCALVYFEAAAIPRLLVCLLAVVCALYIWVVCQNLIVILINRNS